MKYRHFTKILHFKFYIRLKMFHSSAWHTAKLTNEVYVVSRLISRYHFLSLLSIVSIHKLMYTPHWILYHHITAAGITCQPSIRRRCHRCRNKVKDRETSHLTFLFLLSFSLLSCRYLAPLRHNAVPSTFSISLSPFPFQFPRKLHKIA